ncbi:MAG: SCP2 sterol-binding domain-containing protein [Actinomycetota bacterium]
MTDVLSDAWIGQLVEASAARTSERSGVVELAIGKTKQARFEIADGRVVGPTEAEAGVRVPVTGKQLTALLDGEESLAQAFMRGDVKPEGATGPLLALVELFEDATFREQLAALA